MQTATALSHPNIAFIKYWGNRDHVLRLPASGSISMNLGGLHTRTTVAFNPDLTSDTLTLNGQPALPTPLQRASRLLDRVRELAHLSYHARITSENNFPAGAGIASSASAFAALAQAASAAAGLGLDERALSRLARTGSGSACRSVPGGFSEWLPGGSDADSYAHSIAPAEHWDLADCIAVVSTAHKDTGSTEGHRLADTSPLQAARVASATQRLDQCRQAVMERDFEALAEVAELDSNLMHAVMQTSTPHLLYYLPPTVAVMQAVTAWRAEGLPTFYTIDAGPNVHVLTPAPHQGEITERLRAIPGVQRVITARAGGPARLVAQPE
jgi:diphosphomevalonate decarboxylase